MNRSLCALGAALLASACATDKVTLLDNDGQGGAIAVLASDGRESVIDQANTEAKLRDGPTRAKAVTRIKPAYTALLDTLPPAAKGFAITFPMGETRIPVDQRPILQQIRNELAIRQGPQIEVAGFTDSTGSDDYNDKVSRERAEAVAQELRQSGFQVDANDAVGRGEDEAKKARGDNVPDESYRRVVVIIR